MLGLAALVALAAAGRTDAAPPRRPPDIEVEAELLAKSPNPRPRDIWVYQEGLSVYKYKVLKTLRGQAAAETILVAHWAVKRNIEQPITKTAVGATLRLRLRPFDEMPELREVFRSDTLGEFNLPLYQDVGQPVVLPEEERGRWNYGVELSQKMPTFLLLKDQLRIVVLGDCQAAVAHKAELYGGPENLRTPIAYNLCQERACLEFHKLLVEQYLVHLPRLEWVLFSWNPRYVNGSWPTHGTKAAQFLKSPGHAYDAAHPEAFRPAAPRPPIRVEQILAVPELARAWGERPWGWRVSPSCTWTDPMGQIAAAQKQKGAYRFSEERWGLFASLLKTLVDRKVKVLAFIGPYHPETAKVEVKDKDGVTAPDYEDQVRRMEDLERQYPGRFFFYDFNRMGRHGLLEPDDFGDVDHPNGRGAVKFTRHMEEYRLALEARAAAP